MRLCQHIENHPSLTKTQATLKRLTKSWVCEDQGFLIECRALAVTEDDTNSGGRKQWTSSVHPGFGNLLQEFSEVLQWPNTLPPQREIDHCTHLKEGTPLVNVRPYRYKFAQKKEIENLVNEMLAG